MAPATRTQNAIVAVLASFAVAASSYAVWSVGRPHPSLAESAAGPGSLNPLGGRGIATAMPTSEDTTEVTEVPEGEDPADEAQGPAPSVVSWVSAWSGAADMLVIGDGFSNMPNQWVQLWAAHLGDDRPVQIHHWGEAADVAFNDPIVLSDTGDPPLTVWSASRDGSTIQAAADRYERFVEASATPDAVLITMGRSSADEKMGDGLDALVSQIDEGIPALLAIGPEDLYEHEVGDALLTWAEDNADRVSVVDLRERAPSAPTAEEWARAFQEALES